MIEVLGDMLLTQPFDRSENRMPSPEQLIFKFILKHKRLPEKVDGDQSVTIRHHDDCRVLYVILVYCLYLFNHIFF